MATDETSKVVQGWKAMTAGKKQTTRKERILNEKITRSNNPDPDKVTPEMKRQALLEAQKEKENEIEDPMRHLRNAYRTKVQEEKASKTVKLDATKTLMLLCEISEKAGKIVSVEEAGFNIYKITYII